MRVASICLTLVPCMQHATGYSANAISMMTHVRMQEQAEQEARAEDSWAKADMQQAYGLVEHMMMSDGTVRAPLLLLVGQC